MTVDGAAATAAPSGERDLIVTPAEPVRRRRRDHRGGHLRRLTADAGGRRLLSPGWFSDGEEVYAAFEPHGAATLFPANDHPSDKAAYTFRVTVPEGLDVAANGLLSGTTPGDGVTTWVYEAPDQMATYLVQVVIADLDFVESARAPTGCRSATPSTRTSAALPTGPMALTGT